MQWTAYARTTDVFEDTDGTDSTPGSVYVASALPADNRPVASPGLSRRFLGALGVTSIMAALAQACRAPAPATEGPRPRREVTLQVIYPPTSDPDLEIFTRIFQRFEQANPGFRINHDAAPIGHGAALAEKLITQVAGGAPSDVSLIHPSWSVSLLSKGLFLQLDDIAKKDKALQFEDILPYCLDFYRIEGRLYGLPYYSGPGMLFFNRSLFNKYGVKTPDQYEKEGRWTWETFLEVTKALTHRTEHDPTYGYERVDQGLQWYLSVPVWAWGGELFNRDETEFRGHERAAVEALQFQADMVTLHRVVPVGPEVQAIPAINSRRINSGRIGIQYGGKFYVPDLKDAATFELGIAPVPKGPAGRWTRDGNNGFGILKDSRQHDDSYRLCAFMTQWDGGAQLLLESGRPQPVRKSLYDNGTFRKLLLSWEDYDTYVETARIVRVWRIPKAGPEVQVLFDQQWNAVLRGEKSVQGAMNDLRGPMNELLRRAQAG